MSAEADLAATTQEVRMIRWNPRFARLFMVLGALASFAIAAGAGCRWGD